MAKLKLRFEWLPIVLAVLMLAGSSAEAKTDIFFAAIGPNNEFLDGGGSGYGYGKWHFYPNAAWWSEWFYSGPYTPSLRQLFDVSLIIEPLQADQPCLVQIAYSWTTSVWPQLGRNRPPLLADVKTAADEAKFIQRRMFFSSRFPPGSKPITFKRHLEIPYYNPQWVSIEVRGRNFLILDGSIDHRSVPKDSAIAAASQRQLLQTTGACCLPDGSCLNTDQRTCAGEGGTFMGDGTNCRTTDCIPPPPQTQACCLPDGSCQNLSEDQCRAIRGEPQGPGTTCATVSCPQPPTQACCFVVLIRPSSSALTKEVRLKALAQSARRSLVLRQERGPAVVMESIRRVKKDTQRGAALVGIIYSLAMVVPAQGSIVTIHQRRWRRAVCLTAVVRL